MQWPWNGIQIGSALAYRSIPLQASYCGAKHAIRGYMNSLRAGVAAQSPITVSIVELPAVNTPQRKADRFGLAALQSVAAVCVAITLVCPGPT